eukprot:4464221-Prorocentrum_lima.AAC.1
MGNLLLRGPGPNDPPIEIWDVNEERFSPGQMFFPKDDKGEFIPLPGHYEIGETIEEQEFGIEPDVYEMGPYRE